MTTLRRSMQAGELAAWGLGRDGLGWWQLAACAGTPDLHTADLRAGWQTDFTAQAQARHICRAHCPVLDRCRRDAERHRPADVTQGGVVWVSKGATGGRVATAQPRDPGCGVWCQHLRQEAA